MMPERSITPLLQKMHENGYSLKRFADEVNVHFQLNITKSDVSNFIHHRVGVIARRKRNLIRLFFIAHGWIPKSGRRKIPLCKNCGVKYPTGKQKRSSLTVHKIRMLIEQHNHNRTTKN